MELMAFKRYWYHPESDALWSSNKDELLNSDGLVEEITYTEYEELKRKKEINMDLNSLGAFDANQHTPNQLGPKVPVGKWPFGISNTAIEPTKNQDGGMFVVTFSTPHGEIKFRYNLWNQSPKAVEVAHGQLSALCHATGVFKINWATQGAELRGAQGMIDVGLQDPDKPDGYTEVKKVYDRNGNEPGKAPAQAPQVAQPHTMQPPNQSAGGWGASGNAAQQATGWGNANPNAGQAQPNPPPQQPQAPQGWTQGPTMDQNAKPPWAK
jgi:hypothetical protein